MEMPIVGHDLRDDGSLLAEFAGGAGEGAFAALVDRHMRSVLGVCQRVLGEANRAEDAAQAVFLMLAHKAKSLQHRASVSGWLYETAWNVSQNAARGLARQRKRERDAGHQMRRATGESDDRWDELKGVLDRELSALPEKYRSALVLHYLQSRPCEEAARASGCALGAFVRRLERARELLRGRLVRHGVAVSGAALFALISEKALASTVPAALVTSTVKAAAHVAAAKGLSGLVSVGAEELLRGGLKALTVAKVKVTAGVLAFAGVLGAGGGVVAYKTVARPEKEKVVAEAPAKPEPPPYAVELEKNLEAIRTLVRPQPGEYAWREEIPWQSRLQPAREKAAAENKPILVLVSNNSNPLGRT